MVHIAVVEDYDVVVNTIIILLKRAELPPCEIHSFLDGDEFLDYCNSSQDFDIVIVDPEIRTFLDMDLVPYLKKIKESVAVLYLISSIKTICDPVYTKPFGNIQKKCLEEGFAQLLLNSYTYVTSYGK